MTERGRTQLTNNYDEERLRSISRSLCWRTDGILISPSDYSFLRERIDYWKGRAADDRIQMMLERNDARWTARKLWNWAVAELNDDMDRAWKDMPEWMQKAIIGDD